MWKPKVCRRTGFIVVLSLFGGCSDPEAIYPAAPPGFDPQALAREQTKEEPGEALGEVAPQSGSQNKPVLPNIPAATPTSKGEKKKTESGVEYETIKEGTGAVAKVGQRATLHYVGTLEDGRKFDSSRDPGKEPFTFEIGMGKVIKGWDESIPGMHIGEIRKLTIPPGSAYGSLGKGTIPPNATLLFEVELINLE